MCLAMFAYQILGVGYNATPMRIGLEGRARPTLVRISTTSWPC